LAARIPPEPCWRSLQHSPMSMAGFREGRNGRREGTEGKRNGKTPTIFGKKPTPI